MAHTSEAGDPPPQGLRALQDLRALDAALAERFAPASHEPAEVRGAILTRAEPHS